jgi:hypothetical protein
VVTSFAMPAPNPVIGALLTLAAARPPRVELTDDSLSVRLGLAWSVEVPRTSIRGARCEQRGSISIGAHGFRGRWLVNTVGRNLATVVLDPPARGRCLGVPVTVRELTLSLEDPAALVDALT